jgi:CDGSH-type Zn-finger protein
LKTDKKLRIRIIKNGPYIVEGGLPLAEETEILGADAEPERWTRGESLEAGETYALCRCGRTENRPFCDGKHVAAPFDGTETAKHSFGPETIEMTQGPALDLADIPCLCAIARFCHREGDAWTLAEQSGDSRKKAIAVESAGNCPSGRLSAWDKEPKKPLEPAYEPSLGAIKDTYHGGLGPIWVKGGVEIVGADGEVYEKRGRVTLCRCGHSTKKPLCDGAHVKFRFGKEEELEKT